MAAVAAASISACGGGGGGGAANAPAADADQVLASATLNGSIVKGPVQGATVCAYVLVATGKGDLLGCTTSLADGSYSLQVQYSGEVFLEATGGSYTDEASGTPNVPLAEPLAAVGTAGPAPQTLVATPLTALAVQQASAGGRLTLAGYGAAAAQVAGAFGLPGTLSLSQTVPRIGGAADTAAGQYGAALTGVSRMLGQGATLRGIIHSSDLSSLEASFHAAAAPAPAPSPAPAPAANELFSVGLPYEAWAALVPASGTVMGCQVVSKSADLVKLSCPAAVVQAGVTLITDPSTAVPAQLPTAGLLLAGQWVATGEVTLTTRTPNILILLDNSANWNSAFSAGKSALASLLAGLPVNDDGTAAFNVGLMMFTEAATGDVGPQGGYVRAAVRPMDAGNKARYADLVSALHMSADRAPGARSSLLMMEAYRYLTGGAVHAGAGKLKADYANNQSGSAADDAVHALQGNAQANQSSSLYTSPVQWATCPPTAVVYISNGLPSESAGDLHQASFALAAAGGSTSTLPLSPSMLQDNVADEWARWMRSSSLGATVYTLDVQKLGTGLGPSWSALLRSMAQQGGGSYHDVAADASALQDALETIFTQVRSRATVPTLVMAAAPQWPCAVPAGSQVNVGAPITLTPGSISVTTPLPINATMPSPVNSTAVGVPPTFGGTLVVNGSGRLVTFATFSAAPAVNFVQPTAP